MNAAMRHGMKAFAMIAMLGIIASISAMGANGGMVDSSIMDDGTDVEAAGIIEALKMLSQSGISNPQDLKVRSGDNSATLSWSPPKYLNGTTLIGYIVQRSIDGGQWSNLTMIDPKTRKFTDQWVSNGQVVMYRIVAVSEGGWSSPSNEASARPVGLPWPPISVIATIYGTSVVIEWKAPIYNGGSEITSYTIYRRTDIEGVFREVAKVEASEMRWIDDDVSGNSTVRYYIMAENGAGSSGPSVVSSVSDVPSDEIVEDSYGTGAWPYILGGSAIACAVVASSAIWIWRRKSSRKTMAPMPIPYQAQCVQATSVGACP